MTCASWCVPPATSSSWRICRARWMALTALVSIVWAVLTVVLWRADVYRRVERAAARALGRGDATARPGA
ncbi:MAG: hypothetical protein R3C32_07005 [Chloroflexota bacterium]